MNNSNNNFIKLEALSGILLILMLIFALILANSPWHFYYEKLQELPIGLRIGDFKLEHALLLWVNKGLMSIFFLLLSLEIKREMIEGSLSNLNQIVLPITAAIGGIVCPIFIFMLFNFYHKEFIQGWPIATTTDIAFMLGIITLLRHRVCYSMKVILVALSIIDDIFAVILLALYYTDTLSFWAVFLGVTVVIALFILNRCKVESLVPYAILGVLLWWLMVQSGIHATLTGVILGMMIPLRSNKEKNYSPLKYIEDKLHPWVAFCILPVFVLFNGGVYLGDNTFSQMVHPLYLGISLGLCLGKTIGVFLFSVIVLKLGYAVLPNEINYRQLLGCAALTGIGFTMSLFFTGLAFSDLEGPLDNLARQAVLFGSLISALMGILILVTNKRVSAINQ